MKLFKILSLMLCAAFGLSTTVQSAVVQPVDLSIAEPVGQQANVCSNCKKADAPCQMCSRCMQVFYCSTECQKNAWKSHKEFCKKKLVVAQPEVFEDDKIKTSRLVNAIVDNHSKAQAMIEAGVRLDIPGRKGQSPLFAAAYNGKSQLVELILKKGAEVNSPNGEEMLTPLLAAVGEGHRPVVTLLLEYHAGVNLADATGCTPLIMATQKGYRDLVKILLEHRAAPDLPDNKGYTPLIFAIKSGCRDLVEILLEHGATVDLAYGESLGPLCTAVYHKKNSLVRLLLDNKADIDQSSPQGQVPLCIAAEGGDSSLVSLLLDSNPSPAIDKADGEDYSPLCLAASFGHCAVIGILLEHGAAIDGAAIDGTDLDGFTPLIVAVSEGQIGSVVILIEKGASVDKSTNRGITPLSYAAQDGFLDIVEYLIFHKAAVNSQDLDGRTPLYFASTSGHYRVAKALINHGADIALGSKKGKNPLYMAAAEGYFELVKILVEKLLEEKRAHVINQPAKNRKTPALIAEQNGHQEIASYLQRVIQHYLVQQQVNDVTSSFADLSIADLEMWIGELDSMKQSSPSLSVSKQKKINRKGQSSSNFAKPLARTSDRLSAVSSPSSSAKQDIKDFYMSEELQRIYEEGDFSLVEQRKSHNSKVSRIDVPNGVCFHDQLNNTRIIVEIPKAKNSDSPSWFRSTNISYADRIGSKEKSDYRHMFPLKIDRCLDSADWSQRESSDGELQWHAELYARFIYLDDHSRHVDYFLEYTFNEDNTCYHRFARLK